MLPGKCHLNFNALIHRLSRSTQFYFTVLWSVSDLSSNHYILQKQSFKARFMYLNQIIDKWKEIISFSQSQKLAKTFCHAFFLLLRDIFLLLFRGVANTLARGTLSKQLQPPCIFPCLNTSSIPVFILASEKDWIGALLKTTLGPEFSILDVNMEIFLTALSIHNHQHVIFLFLDLLI